MRFAGSTGSMAKKIFPESFSNGPAAPNAWPPARSLRDCTSIRTTSAESGAAERTSTTSTRETLASMRTSC